MWGENCTKYTTLVSAMENRSFTVLLEDNKQVNLEAFAHVEPRIIQMGMYWFAKIPVQRSRD